MKALALHITGIVQGVGFRPFVYNLAVDTHLDGWVLNASDGVHVLVQGEDAAVDGFPQAIRDCAPAMSVIETVVAEDAEPDLSIRGFEIRASHAEPGAMTLVSPDIATCPQCVTELFSRDDRRYRYPFINCTNCGPRFTIIEDVPYDRPVTTMRDFPMCPDCSAEYGDPRDRRFHAQPDACFVCGPRLFLMPTPDATGVEIEPGWAWSPNSEVTPRPHRDRDAERARSDAILTAAARLLREGRILAVKGLGGFHLACDATNADAVRLLRERKHRWGKPLAIMVADADAARALARVDEREEALLTGTIRPVVLLRKRDDTPLLADGVADGLREIGVMLPYTPLHHLLLAEVGVPLVMTSGNLSDEPIATGNAEALARLAPIADAFLLHDREIHSRYDDSVVRVVTGETELVRRARGYAPYPLPLPFETDTDILAAGSEQKNTFTLLTGAYGFVSQHIGDLENAETLASFESTVALYERLFRIEPRIVAYDLHPEYLSTKWALATDLPKVGVQHHHAHIVSVTAEHGIAEKVVGVALDGTGYGTDGTIWGGEVLVCDWERFERVAHLAPVPMPGGSAAIRRPARMALATLDALGLLEHPGAAALRARLAPGEEAVVLQMARRGINSPLTSSMGRLFDTVSAIAGVADDARYEGEAAILLEACADTAETGAYEFGIRPEAGTGGATIIDPAPMLAALLTDVSDRLPQPALSARFHNAVVNAIVAVAAQASKRAGTRYVALAGGVFMNRLVLSGTVRTLTEAGLIPLTHVKLPMNDGAVSFGQAVSAWARRHEL
jgi:hydrogenase maturation protein HypF